MRRRFGVLSCCVLVGLAASARAAIPIQPETGTREGCSPPGSGSCAGAPGVWFGTAGNDSVRVWVGANGAAVDSVRIVVNGTNCTTPLRYVLERHWAPGKAIAGASLPECVVHDFEACVPPLHRGFDLTIAFRSSSCALVELLLFDPAGRNACPTPCPALDEINVAIESRPWGVVKQLYR
jgi:hypothetical protein